MQDAIHTTDLIYLIILAGVISLRSMALRRHTALAAASLALGLAALPAGPHPVTAAFVALGLLGAFLTGIRAGWPGILLGAGAIAGAWASRGLLTAVRVAPTLLAASIVAALAGAGLWLIRVLQRRVGPATAGTSGMQRWPLAVLVGSTALTALATHLSLVFLGAAGASWGGWMMARAAVTARRPLIPPVVAGVLLVTYMFIATVSGPEGLAMNGLAALPLSPAAELLTAAALVLSSWLLCGLWPLHRQSRAPFVAPAAAFLLIRVALVASPGGMEHWRALAAPLAMVGIWYAAAARRPSELAVGGAWLALVSAQPSGVAAAAWLIPSALLLDLLGPEREGESPWRFRARRAVWLAAGWGGLLALEASLGGEVVYSVLAAAGAALGIASGGQAMTPSAPRSTAPSA